jgi:hypothetical protein
MFVYVFNVVIYGLANILEIEATKKIQLLTVSYKKSLLNLKKKLEEPFLMVSYEKPLGKAIVLLTVFYEKSFGNIFFRCPSLTDA